MLGWLQAVLAAVGDVLVLRPQAVLDRAPGGLLPIAAGVALLAGLSTMLGHVAVFAINRVRRLRLLISMALGTVFLALLHLLTATVVALVASLILRGPAPPVTIVESYLLAVAPHVLGVLILIPHLGLAFGRVIEGWTLLCLVFVLDVTLDVSRWQAAVIAGVAWLLSQVLSRVLARPLAAIASRVWTLVTGAPTYLSANDIMAGAPFVPIGPVRQP